MRPLPRKLQGSASGKQDSHRPKKEERKGNDTNCTVGRCRSQYDDQSNFILAPSFLPFPMLITAQEFLTVDADTLSAVELAVVSEAMLLGTDGAVPFLWVLCTSKIRDRVSTEGGCEGVRFCARDFSSRVNTDVDANYSHSPATLFDRDSVQRTTRPISHSSPVAEIAGKTRWVR